MSGQQLIDKYMNWVGTYQIIAFQDPFFFQDMGNYQEFMSKLAKKVQIIGCQQYSTRGERIEYFMNAGRGQLSN